METEARRGRLSHFRSLASLPGRLRFPSGCSVPAPGRAARMKRGSPIQVRRERHRYAPKTKVTDEVDCNPVKDMSPESEPYSDQLDEETTDSPLDLGASGDSAISSRTRSHTSSDQNLQQPNLSRRPLRSTRGQKDAVTPSNKVYTELVSPALPRTELSPKEDERSRKLAQKGSADTSNKNMIFILMIVVGVFSVLFLINTPQSVTLVERTTLTVFLDNFKQVQALFYGQQSALWKRSRITLCNHINLTRHEKPAILMFVAASDGRKTMRCLTRQIADAYSSALNATAAVEVDATGISGQNSDSVKLEVDTQLSSGFDKGSKVAVIHHFQDLPPLATLIFYKYCDHENAAYKAVALLITILLDEEKLAPDISLKVLEMKVRDFLIRRFSASEGSQGMDTDKLSGLWSRVAHVVLPVAPVREIEEGGCVLKEH